VAGPRAVAWAEDVVYGLEDRVQGLLYQDAPPRTFWDDPTAPPDDPAPAQDAIASMAPVAPEFLPPSFSPPVPRLAASRDGKWIPIADPGAPRDPPRMYKTTVHPDEMRGYAAVAVVAIDLARAELHLVAGTREPASAEVPSSARPGLVPEARFGDLMAAFNGGFKAVHGHYGMMLDGQSFLPPRNDSCTVALFQDGSIRIHTWTALADGADRMAAFRQTPPCLLEGGVLGDPTLSGGEEGGRGAAVSGQTAIRRSAIGLDPTGRTLFYAIGESVTVGALGRALKAAGAEDAAQLDVNTSFPRFVVFGRRGDARPFVSKALIPGLTFGYREYIGAPESRDFFYVTRKSR
jgi:hypothetical protein